jgi:putative transposase
MKAKRGYKAELDLNNEQITLAKKHCGAARWAYNYALIRKKANYQQGLPTPYAAELHREINVLKRTDFPWMYEVSKCALQEALRDADDAFKHFFRKVALKKQGLWKGKCGYPRFKSKKKAIGSARFTGHIHVYADAIQLPRLGLLRLKEHDYLPMNKKIGSATLSEHAGRWFVSICVHKEQVEPPKATGEPIGVDLGIKTLATVSDGRTFANPKALRKKLNKLKRAARQHSRKQKGSKNRQQARQRLAKMHVRIANVRKDALHKATSALVAKTKPESERPRVIVLEDLNVSGMLKNHKLALACADVGLYEFRRQVEYKARFAGVEVLFASRWYPSSKTCHACQHVVETLPLSIREWTCPQCWVWHNRDLNAALNLAALA